MDAFMERAKQRADKIKIFKKRKDKKTCMQVPTAGGVYVGHIPHGFYEEEMKQYFTQFGDVEDVYLRRSKKTGGSRGYAIVVFKVDEVAKIAAETMNNYLFFERILKCEYVPLNWQNLRFFKSWKLGTLTTVRNRQLCNKRKTYKQLEQSKLKRVSRLMKLKSILSETGISFDVEQFLPKEGKLDTVKSETINLDTVQSENINLDTVQSENIKLDTVQSEDTKLDSVN